MLPLYFHLKWSTYRIQKNEKKVLNAEPPTRYVFERQIFTESIVKYSNIAPEFQITH